MARSSRRRRFGILVVLVIVVTASAALAQIAPTTAPELDVADVRTRLEQLQTELEQREESTGSEQWSSLLRRHERVLSSLGDELQRRSELDVPPQVPTPVPEGPVSVAALDAAMDEADRLQAAVSAQDDVVELHRNELRSLREARDEVARRLRALRSGSAAQEEAPLALVERQDRVLADEVSLEQLRLDNEVRLLSNLQASLQVVERGIPTLRSRLEPNPEALATVLAALEDEERQLSTRQRRAEEAAAVARDRLATARQREATGQIELAARSAKLQHARRDAAIAAEELQLVARLRDVWRQRWSVLGGALSWEAMHEERDASLELKSTLTRQLRQTELEIEQHEQTLRRIESAGAASGDRWVQQQTASLEQLVDAERGHRQRLSRALTVVERHLDELDQRLARPTLGQRVVQLGRQLGAVWRYELIAYDDHPLTVGKLILAGLLLVAGLVLSGRLSRLIVNRLTPRFDLTQSSAATTQTVLRYILVLIVALIALRIANIPLTVFTLLGGALAIGIGFGSQNVLSNFISGLILLVERPIKVGDLVEVGGTFGRVEHIGPRSTFVRTPENIHIIVPNASFLEQEVINWTLSDHSIRSTLRVGVAYGSPVREVERLLYTAVREHSNVLGEPEPNVLFADFGDSALLFEAEFWTTIRTQLDRRRLLSDLRFRIDELFREAGIVIAFPQRDVHLDTTRPLDVRISPQDPGKP